MSDQEDTQHAADAKKAENVSKILARFKCKADLYKYLTLQKVCILYILFILWFRIFSFCTCHDCRTAQLTTCRRSSGRRSRSCSSHRSIRSRCLAGLNSSQARYGIRQSSSQISSAICQTHGVQIQSSLNALTSTVFSAASLPSL